jgi:hypothetical protein
MRSKWKGLGAALLCLAGCWTTGLSLWPTEPTLKPPPSTAEYILPPADDPRFSGPPVFPEKTLNEGLKKDQDPSQPGGLKSPGRFGAGGPGSIPGGF